MDKDTKAAFAKLTTTVKDGFATIQKQFSFVDKSFTSIDKRFAAVESRMETGFAAVEARMEKGFAAVAEDFADIKDRLTSVESKVAGTNRRLDNDAMMRDDLAMPQRVSDLEQKTFGASRHPKHLPL